MILHIVRQAANTQIVQFARVASHSDTSTLGLLRYKISPYEHAEAGKAEYGLQCDLAKNHYCYHADCHWYQ